MSKSIHKTIASARLNNTKAELGEPDNVDVAALAKKRGYKKVAKTERRDKSDTAVGSTSSNPGRAKA